MMAVAIPSRLAASAVTGPMEATTHVREEVHRRLGPEPGDETPYRRRARERDDVDPALAQHPGDVDPFGVGDGHGPVGRDVDHLGARAAELVRQRSPRDIGPR